jgi:hypothetical protein
MNGRILVLNSHEAWVHQLRLLQTPLDIVGVCPGGICEVGMKLYARYRRDRG